MRKKERPPSAARMARANCRAPAPPAPGCCCRMRMVSSGCPAITPNAPPMPPAHEEASTSKRRLQVVGGGRISSGSGGGGMVAATDAQATPDDPAATCKEVSSPLAQLKHRRLQALFHLCLWTLTNSRCNPRSPPGWTMPAILSVRARGQLQTGIAGTARALQLAFVKVICMHSSVGAGTPPAARCYLQSRKCSFSLPAGALPVLLSLCLFPPLLQRACCPSGGCGYRRHYARGQWRVAVGLRGSGALPEFDASPKGDVVIQVHAPGLALRPLRRSPPASSGCGRGVGRRHAT